MATSNDSTCPETQQRPLKEQDIEYGFLEKLKSLKYEYRPDITDIEKYLFVVDRKDNGQDKRYDPSRNLHPRNESVCQTQ